MAVYSYSTKAAGLRHNIVQPYCLSAQCEHDVLKSVLSGNIWTIVFFPIPGSELYCRYINHNNVVGKKEY